MRFILLIAATILLFVLNLFFGSVSISPSEVLAVLTGNAPSEGPVGYIILGSRLPQAITALLAGAGLAVSGLLLQTAFRNPLAGPSILGINSGASLGVALIMLLFGGSVTAAGISMSGQIAVMFGAFVGSIAIIGLLLLFSTWLKNNLMLLITGIMVGYLTSSVITLLNYSSSAEGVQSYVMWGMGSFNGITMKQIPGFATGTIVGLLLATLLVKPLNTLLLGDNYARNLGVNLQLLRNSLLLATGLLTACITAYCGPVSFIGLAVPHIARLIFRVSDHRVIMPGCMLTGSVVALLCNLLCVLPSGTLLPLNGVTPLIGVPVVLYVIFHSRKH